MMNIIIDCDPGQDDAIAILLAIANDNLIINGITTVAGNVSGEQTYINAKKVCKCADRLDIKIYKGAMHPLKKKLITAEFIHGKNGLSCDVNINNVSDTSEDAVTFIIETLLRAKEKITIVAMAALTNIALALQKEPKIKDHIEKVVLMGGSTNEGNITKYAEFNFFTDPHAAQIIFSSGLDIVMIGLNVTEQAVFEEKEIQRISMLGNKVSEHAVIILNDLMKTNREVYGFKGGLVHDACVIAYLIDPSIFKLSSANVQIEIENEIKMGKSYVNFNAENPNASVAVGINTEKLFNLFENSFKNYSYRTQRIA